MRPRLKLSAHLKGEDDDNDFEDEDEALEFVSFQSTKPKSAQNWQNKLKETLALAPRRAPANNYNRYVALVVMTRSQLGYYGYRQSSPSYSYALEPFIIKANAWNLLHENTLKYPARDQ